MRRIPATLIVLAAAWSAVSCASRAEPRGPWTLKTADAPAPTPAALGAPRSDTVARALPYITAPRAMRDVEDLVAFGTRHTESETSSPTRGIGAARTWVAEQFRAAATDTRPMDVELVGHTQHPVEGRITRPVEILNVVATLPGSLPPELRQEIWVLAHLDSRITERSDSVNDSPGANDDASGVAVLLALARALGEIPLDHTVILAATSGEEQGLFGAAELARRARARSAPIRAILNNDTVGDPIGHHAPGSVAAREAARAIRVFSVGIPADATPEEVARISALGAESDSLARQVARFMVEIAAIYNLPVRPALVYRNDRFLRGGDHTAFIREDYDAAVRLTVPYEDYTRQHEDIRTVIDESTGRAIPYGDTADHIDPEYLAAVARLNLATVIHLASAPTAPADVRILTATLDTSTTLRWSPSPDPDVAGYEVVTRQTSDPMWTRVFPVPGGPDATETTLPLSKDNLLFGIRAFDAEGYRSLVTFAGAARE